jgi:hypothetical protein
LRTSFIASEHRATARSDVHLEHRFEDGQRDEVAVEGQYEGVAVGETSEQVCFGSLASATQALGCCADRLEEGPFLIEAIRHASGSAQRGGPWL